ncbi:hypothetical protein DPMN_108374 [Dreissena polymorpha]|uniref:Uncharacterized protein n=1 Tax=Dreissena polymorpha TaxID=45954 RepID=A0A9D4QKX4_DREPO|nr:hypothetical protein DPMN_108374 [Dreissena polymorpha]
MDSTIFRSLTGNVTGHIMTGPFTGLQLPVIDRSGSVTTYQLPLQYQSPGIGHDRDLGSTSDHMATPVSRSLPDGIGQGHRPMPDHLASAIRSLSGDNTGHDMTGTSPGTLITDH